MKSIKSSIDSSLLKAIPYEMEAEIEVSYVTEEFTTLCPWTELPDFGRLTITYVPHKKLVELKSLKYYLLSYRNAGIINEHAVARILKDLSSLVKPRSMEVKIEFTPRGGIKTVVVGRYPQRSRRKI